MSDSMKRKIKILVLMLSILTLDLAYAVEPSAKELLTDEGFAMYKDIVSRLPSCSDCYCQTARATSSRLHSNQDSSTQVSSNFVNCLLTSDKLLQQMTLIIMQNTGDSAATESIIALLNAPNIGQDVINQARRALADLAPAATVQSVVDQWIANPLHPATLQEILSMHGYSPTTAQLVFLMKSDDSKETVWPMLVPPPDDLAGFLDYVAGEVTNDRYGPTDMNFWYWWASIPSTRVQLDKLLASRSVKVRRWAAQQIVSQPWAVSYFVGLLSDSDPEVRITAANGLGWTDSKEALSPLLERLYSDSVQLRVAVIEALGNLGNKKAIPLIQEFTNDENLDLRNAAVETLAKLGDTQAKDLLVAQLNDPDLQSRKSAIAVLVAIGDPRIAPVLLDEALSDSNLDSQYRALSNLLKLNKPDVQQSILNAFPRINDALKIPLAKDLVAVGNKNVIGVLADLLRHPDRNIRIEAITILGDLREEAGVDPLIVHLLEIYARSHEAELAAEATYQNMLIDEQVTSEQILDFLTSFQNRTIFGEDEVDDVYAALAKIGGTKAAGALLDVTSEKPILGTGLLRAIGLSGDPRAAEYLIPMVEDIASPKRRQAAGALGLLGDRKAVPPLMIMAQSKNPADVKAAIWALMEMGELADLGALLRSEIDQAIVPYRLRDQIFLANHYSSGLPTIFNISSTNTTYRQSLPLISTILNWGGPSFLVPNSEIEQELADMQRSTSMQGWESNPYFSLLMAQIKKNNYINEDAIWWADTTIALSPGNQAALHIVARWLKIEALIGNADFNQAFRLISEIEHQFLPQISHFEKFETGLPFLGYTLALKGILMGYLNQPKQNVADVLWKAKEALVDKYVSETMRDRTLSVIGGNLSTQLGNAAIEEAHQTLEIANRIPQQTALEVDSVQQALRTSIRDAISTGEYELAQYYSDKLILTQQPAPVEVHAADEERELAYQQFRRKQQKIVRSNTALDDARRELEKAKDGGEEENAQIAVLEAQKKAMRAQRDFKLFMVGLKEQHPAVTTLVANEPANLAQLRKKLEPGQLLVQYVLDDHEGWIFIVDQKDVLDVAKLDYGRLQLKTPIRSFLVSIQQNAEQLNSMGCPDLASGSLARKSPQPDPGTYDLSDLLLKPLAEYLKPKSGQHLVIVPSGPLNRLPFAALQWDGDFLINQFDLSLLSSASIATALGSNQVSADEIIVLGDPTPPSADWQRLPCARIEAEAIREYFSTSTVLLDEKAGSSALKAPNPSDVQFHLAVHAQVGGSDNAGLVLSDGFMKLADVWGLPVENSPLVVLSACQTGVGNLVAGEEVLSLANGFIYAGARSVISTLWAVSDKSTSLLMMSFYKHRNLGNPQALAEAQRQLIRQGYDPFHWAGFIVSGL